MYTKAMVFLTTIVSLLLTQSVNTFSVNASNNFISTYSFRAKDYLSKDKSYHSTIKGNGITVEFCTTDESTGDTFCEFLDQERNDGPGWGIDKLRIYIKGPYNNVDVKIVHITKTVVSQKNVDITLGKSFYIRNVWCSDVYLHLYKGKKLILKRIMEYRGC